MDSFQIQPHELDKFICSHLQPDERFLKLVAETIDRICTFLKDQCPYKISKAVKGGSLGKGTALINSSDADLVIFLSCFKSFQDQRDNRHEVLDEIQKMLEKCSRSLAYDIHDIEIKIRQSKIPPKSMRFILQSTKSSAKVKFDVLPSYDALTPLYNYSAAHLELINFVNGNAIMDGEFSPCFTELQTEFVKRQPSKVKDLIRLMKYWYKLHVKPRKSELRGGARLPAKYAVELMTIYAWEQGNHQERFDTAQGFRTVLDLICRHQDVCIYWTDYYDVTNPTLADFLTKKLHGNRALILDPADPTGNVASSDGWNVMQNVARKCLSMPCVSNVQAWNVQPVKTFEITVTSPDGKSLRLKDNIYSKVSEVKHNIQEKWTIPVSQQCLTFNGTILDDGKTLLDSSIFFDATIQLLTLMDIFVDYNERNLTIQVSPNDKVSSLKNNIESLERLQRSQYYLTFQSKPLEDKQMLKDYGIKQHSTIYVKLQLRGGNELQCSSAEGHSYTV
ncbi:2'-5'-oligoadenylate synthase 1-like [Rhinoraja longicauda]